MSTVVRNRTLLPSPDSRMLLIKWIVALLVPLAVFTFVWSGEGIVNNVLLGLVFGQQVPYASSTFIPAALFILIFYATLFALVGYLVAADSGRRSMYALWGDMLVFAVIPILLISNNAIGLIIGLAISAIIWALFIAIRNRIRKAWNYVPPVSLASLDIPDSAIIWALFIAIRNRIRKAWNYVPPVSLASLNIPGPEQKALFVSRATMAGFWFATLFAFIWLIVDIIFYVTGSLPAVLLIWVLIRTLVLPAAGYFLGRLGGRFALRYVLSPKKNGNGENGNSTLNITKKTRLETLSTARVREEAKDFVPNDAPLLSTGARRFYILLLVVFLLLYPFIDSYLFGPGTDGRVSGYADAGYYVILALGLNIVVGFAGLLDLGYVAFFAIGAYTWGIVGSSQFTVLTGIQLSPLLASALFLAGAYPWRATHGWFWRLARCSNIAVARRLSGNRHARFW